MGRVAGDEADVLWVYGLGHRSHLAHAQYVEHTVDKAAAGGLLEHEFRRTLSNRRPVDVEQIAGPYKANTRRLGSSAQTIARAQTEQSKAVVSTDPEFVDFDRSGRELWPRNQQN